MNKPMEELNRLVPKLPTVIVEDINKRVGDWLASGGDEDAPYIKQQVRFAKNYLKYKK